VIGRATDSATCCVFQGAGALQPTASEEIPEGDWPHYHIGTAIQTAHHLERYVQFVDLLSLLNTTTGACTLKDTCLCDFDTI